MKKLLSLALLCAALPAQAVIDSIDAVPAATLLLPYFEVDTNNVNGNRTVFTVGNSSSTEVLAHVTLWTDRGVPTYNFNLRLAGYDVAEIDLRELIVNGTVPTSAIGGFAASCTGQLPPANLNATQITGLRNAHTGTASSLLGGMCGGVARGDGLARGYVTVDSVSACTSLVPGDTGYFTLGGSGIANNNNVLWGEQSTYNAAFGNAYGDTLVHIEASATNPATDGTGVDYTFYGRRIAGSGADNREGLAQSYMGRFSFLGVIDGTKAQIWRDPGLATAYACASPPAGLSSNAIAAFDYQEQVSLARPAALLPYAAQSLNLASPTQAAVPFALGFIYYDLGLPTAAAPFGTANQGYVSHVLTSTAGNAGQTGGWPLFPITQPINSPFSFAPFPECSDGIDNDADGRIDFPADPQCASATSLSENPQCGDGLDNDADTFVDFPLDPECSTALDPTENQIEQQCRDGRDNDGDGLIDFPADPQCFSPFDNTEGFGQCDDGIDNDGDTLIDFPADTGCTSRTDTTETAELCADGIDNDGDTRIDFPADPGCQSITSNIENPQCNNTTDDDADSLIDFPADLGCTAAFDNSEANAICMDGLDNDADGLIDFPADPGCANATSNIENPQCNNGIDNDGDGLIDFPADPGCSAASDTSEFTEQCSDGRDNDGDGLTDFPFETGCVSARDDFEGPDCSLLDGFPDGMGGFLPTDNDLDGLANFGPDPGCVSAADLNELADSVVRACSDGLDNDGDLLVDFPQDTGCSSAYDDLEFLPGEAQGVLTAVPAMSNLGLLLVAALTLLIGGFGLRRRARAE